MSCPKCNSKRLFTYEFVVCPNCQNLKIADKTVEIQQRKASLEKMEKSLEKELESSDTNTLFSLAEAVREKISRKITDDPWTYRGEMRTWHALSYLLARLMSAVQSSGNSSKNLNHILKASVEVIRLKDEIDKLEKNQAEIVQIGAFQLKGDRERRLVNGPFDTNILSNNSYCLNEAEIANFKAIWNKCLQSLASKFNLDYLISKFMEAYEENKPDERILDYVVAFESLVFYNRDRAIEPTGEVIGIAIGMLLGNNQKERDEIKEKLMYAYKVRNAKVHGNVKTLENYRQGMEQLSVKVENYLRCTLRRFVEEEEEELVFG